MPSNFDSLPLIGTVNAARHFTRLHPYHQWTVNFETETRGAWRFDKVTATTADGRKTTFTQDFYENDEGSDVVMRSTYWTGPVADSNGSPYPSFLGLGR